MQLAPPHPAKSPAKRRGSGPPAFFFCSLLWPKLPVSTSDNRHSCWAPERPHTHWRQKPDIGATKCNTLYWDREAEEGTPA